MLSDSKSTFLTAICGVPNILFTEFMPCVSIACLTCGSEKSGEKITVGIAKFFCSSAEFDEYVTEMELDPNDVIKADIDRALIEAKATFEV